MSASKVLAAAKALPLEERIQLAQDLWDDLAKEGHLADLTPDQAAELDRRLVEFEKDPQAGQAWDEVESEINRRFGWK